MRGIAQIEGGKRPRVDLDRDNAARRLRLCARIKWKSDLRGGVTASSYRFGPDTTPSGFDRIGQALAEA